MKKILLFTMLIVYTLFAQQGEWLSYLPEYNYIPDRNVTEILIDHEGNKWVGTFNGLAKYDGENWTQYTPENSGLPDSITDSVPWVYSFAVDGNSNLWVATEKLGIVFYDGETWLRYDTTNSPINGNRIIKVISDKNCGVWISSVDSKVVNFQWVHRYGLDHFDGTNWTYFDLDTLNIPENYISSMEVDYNHNLWIGSIKKLIKFDGNNWFYYEPEIGARQSIQVLKADKDGNVWFGPGSNGLLMFDGINFTYFNELELPRGTMRAIDIDKNNNVWMVGDGIGLAKYDGNVWQLFDSGNSGLLVPNNSTIIVDSAGLVWVGTYVGISTFDGVNWDVIGASGGLPDKNVYAIAIDKNNTKWIGTNRYGLVRYDGEQWRKYITANSDIPGNYVRRLTLDNDDNIWVGTEDNGIAKFDGFNWTIYNKDNSGLPDGETRAIVVDKGNTIWVSTNFNLASFDGDQWKTYDNLPKKQIQDIAIDDSNNVWVATYSGLYKYDGRKWTTFKTSNSELPESGINKIIIDKDGNKWLGMAHTGIVKFDGDNWTVYNTGNSNIAGNEIVSLAEDSLGNIWVGVPFMKGLSKFDGSDWVNYNTIFDPFWGGINPVTIAFDKYGNKWIGDYWQGVLVFNEDKIVNINHTAKSNFANSFKLYQNYPNPFNPSTVIRYDIPKDVRNEKQEVKLLVYNTLGQEIAVLVNQVQSAGSYEVKLNANILSTGIYFYKLQVGNFIEVKKMLLIR